jgi:4-hydroxybenzoate polyprenyltransferase
MSFRLTQHVRGGRPGVDPARIAPRVTGARSVVDFVLRHRIHLLPAAALIVWAAPPLYGSIPSWRALPSVVLGIFGIYELNRVFDVVEDEINDPGGYAKTIATRTLIRGVAVGVMAASILLSMILTGYAATLALSLMLLAGVLYSVPFLGGGRARIRLKQVTGVKNVVPSVVWPLLTIAYPAMSGTGAHLVRLFLAVAALALAVFTIEVAWDARDSRGDRIVGIRTLANTLGARRALLVPLLASCAAALFVVALVYLGRLPMLWLLPALFLILLPAIAYLWRDSFATDRDRSHALILINTLALILLGLAGRWEG